MEVLRDLHELQSAANKRFKEYDGRDFVLPSVFKDMVSEINSSIITYNEFSAIIETKGTQNGVLNIFLPNQWFYIASYFTDFYNELQRYKREALKVTTKERLKELNGLALNAVERRKLNILSLDETSKSYLERFMTDYSWWSGAKTIDRGDFYVSPILNSARLVNASQSFVAELCAFLSDKQELVRAIIDGEEKSGGYDVFSEVNAMQSDTPFRPYLTAIKSKPFLLLAGISGTGKSRMVRELARACWEAGSEEHEAQKPRNFEMVQVKPNWHDSSELIGYVSRISGQAEYVAGDFLRFVARAWAEPDVPYFLCLDEMNLAPVEQYFAEYLSVVESRKADKDGNIATDPILPAAKMKGPGGVMIAQPWYARLIDDLLSGCPTEMEGRLRTQFASEGIALPQNLVVVGTVNMDETTFSFSRKVLDRAMTIEMNEVDLGGGLSGRHEQMGRLGAAELIGRAVEGVDVYARHRAVCDVAIDYLKAVNERLEGTPFKIAYRTRNEALLYVVHNLPYNRDAAGCELPERYVVARALDEVTTMKILSRIEGDETKVSSEFLDGLAKAIEAGLRQVCTDLFDGGAYQSVALAKLEEMKRRLKSGYTSFWS